MKIYYSPSVNGFFTDFHENKPKDCAPIDKGHYEDLILKQESGMKITSDKNGKPVVIAPEIQTGDDE